MVRISPKKRLRVIEDEEDEGKSNHLYLPAYVLALTTFRTGSANRITIQTVEKQR
jgi:hypothetical protein